MLAYQCTGDKQQPKLVLLHGFLGNGSDWLPLLPQLSQHFYCIAIDLPGHGNSGAQLVPEPGFKATVELLLQTLDHLGVNRFHLLGYSLGGRIALHVAQMVPQRLLSLHLESCHPGLLTVADKEQRAVNDTQWATRLAQLPLPQFLTLWYQQPVFAELSADERARLIQRRSHQSHEGLLAMFRATSLAWQQDLHQLPTSCGCPVHYYYGQQDAKFSALAQRWQTRSNIHCHAIAAAGHNSHQANPQQFLAALLPALGSSAEVTP
ncbi:2-succinyl-6-hydroxy-2,4-cyclohexadiene-1-carboxylate synthase [Shewanella dokdonensis]|uniref:Putative 2-succinyl-6-hydroxy-2,4-cyclohexadiene-1-carboxylate synthase n=1 Tax=Shewanella dokdonensis TaxID=712036 RepID=A0ABX8DJ36_9GAMM|nr:2-succinyl-6-hydroxy-2,4-cyclohexadiene-1-carboxylate synthase [Shewanella dokdonensis]MCL1075688.1 2-succinyl-6-hydroxy-2,4-cyclohexadiene-1-carboxylate synthase [Shewanella dokdonensis]QVK24814.1 2-succinyl-6-hydroxy-2,4-cyclohexadiene-1-carboxylate synthase [Shewanella dokdonensis]